MVGASSTASRTVPPPRAVISALRITTGVSVSSTMRALPTDEQAVAERRHQPFARLAGAVRQAEGDVGQIDDHPVGIGQREDLGRHARRQVEREGRLLVGAGKLGVPRLDRRSPCGARC